MSEQEKTQPKLDLSICPRCGAELKLVDGWVEYGDRQFEVQRLGCYTCGYVHDDDYEDDE
jgi:hypothetical protein